MQQLLRMIAVAGLVDAASFVVSRRDALRENPGRGAGSLAGVGLWAALTATSLRERRAGRATLGLAAATALSGGGLLAVHLRARIRNPRVFVTAGLGGAALVAAALSGR